MKHKDNLKSLLATFDIADTLEDAMARKDSLPKGGQFVVREGHTVSRVGIQLYAEDSEQSGLLARAQEIENLDLQLKAQQLILDEAQSEASRTHSVYQSTQLAAQQARELSELAIREAHNLEVERLQLAQAYEKYTVRANQLEHELQEINQAKEILTDPEKKRMYDEVFDLDLNGGIPHGC